MRTATGTFYTAASRYCAAKDEALRLRRSLRKCERRRYAVEDREHPLPGDNDGNEFCSRVYWLDGSPDGGDGRFPVDRWCESCRANLPTVEEMRRVRRSLPGLASAMRRAFRREGGTA